MGFGGSVRFHLYRRQDLLLGGGGGWHQLIYPFPLFLFVVRPQRMHMRVTALF